MHSDLWGGLVLVAMLAFILWAAAGLPVPEVVAYLITGSQKDETPPKPPEFRDFDSPTRI